MPGRVIVLTGPPGAGKSTTAPLVARSFERGVHLRSDDFWHFLASGFIPPWLPESRSDRQAHRTATGRMTAHLLR